MGILIMALDGGHVIVRMTGYRADALDNVVRERVAEIPAPTFDALHDASNIRADVVHIDSLPEVA